MMTRLGLILTLLLIAGCGGSGGFLPEPFTRERADGKIPVKTELIRQQVQRELGGMPEGEAEVARWQQIETDYNTCRLAMRKAKPAVEEVFANCMSKLGYVYMYPLDAEQLHNDIEFEITRERDRRIAAERKAEEERIAAGRKAEEERIAAEKKRRETQEQIDRQKELRDALVAAVRRGDSAEEARLIAEGANPYFAESERKRIAAERKAEEERIIAEKKRQEKQKHTRRQKELDNALIVASRATGDNRVAKVKRLINEGANVNAKNNTGSTPLHYASASGHTQIVHVLIKAGAHIDAKNNKGSTPLYAASAKGKIETLHALIKAGANVYARNNSRLTPLHAAASIGHKKIVLVLIKAGTHVDAKSEKDFTALHRAAYKGHAEIADALIKAGAYVSASGEGGYTPLHFAAQEGKIQTALVLIRAGAHIKAKDNDGKTPLDVARQFERWNIVEILENPPPPKSSGGTAANVATAPAPEDGNVAEQVFTNAWRSVVYIESNGKQGSGVIIKPNIVATNCHVVDSGRIVVYKSRNRRTDKSKRYPATIRHSDTKRDFCLLDVRGLQGFIADVRRYDTLRIGESVYGIGAPQGFDLSLTSGLISQKRKVKGVRQIQTDTAISPGSSGGGLFDKNGNLVGIMTSKIIDDDVEGIGFAIPADLAL